MSSPVADKAPLRWLGPWVGQVNAQTLRADLLAALLAAVLVLPQGLAFATLAGLPPAWGLYSAIVPAFIASLAGSSRHVLTGPTNALSLALAAALAPLAVAGSAEYLRLALVLTLMVGMIQLAVALLRLGTLTHFIAPSVLLGFTTGAALLIAWHALDALGVWPRLDAPALLIGAFTVATALLLRRLWPRGPALLLALVAVTGAAVLVLRWAPAGTVSLRLIGTLPQAWPPFAVPALQWADVPRLATIALALTLVALGQSVAIAKALSQRSGQVLDVNRECLGQGLANIGGAFFSCFASCGSLNRSLPHWQAGARTPLAGVMAALLLLLLVVVAAPLLAWVPVAAISGLLLLVAWALVDRAAWRELALLDRREAAVAAGTALATLLLPRQVAVLAGVAASLVVYLHRTAHPALRSMGFAAPPQPGLDSDKPSGSNFDRPSDLDSDRPFGLDSDRPFGLDSDRPIDRLARPFIVVDGGAGAECPQLKMLRMEGSVWFGAEAHVADALQALCDRPQPQRHLLVMSKSMNFIDAAGAALWERERLRRLAIGGALYFHRPRPPVLALWQASGFLQRLGADRVFADKRSAIAAIVPRLDGAICAGCRVRCFEECARQPGPAGSDQPGSAESIKPA
ncbi:MAG: STAS domain-containing protein [Rubrivivax sp.]|nr:STAS domain-containing protein [Rubrivivax sp.]